jgi:hypothetical protein
MMRDRLDIQAFAQATPAVRRSQAGTGFVPARVIRGLLRANPLRSDPEHSEYGLPVDGYDDYVLRLATDATEDWSGATTYAADVDVIGSNNRKYRSAQAANTNHNPTTDDGTWWTLQAEINPKHYSRGTVDWREFDPWFQVGENVPLILQGGDYLIAQQMVYVGAVHPSRLWLAGDGANGRSGAVFA